MARPFSLALVPDGGILVLRDSEEPSELAQPTTITGTMDDSTGLMTGGTFSAPVVDYDFHITSPVDADVFVDATFTTVTPDSVKATLGEDDTLSVKMQVTADLHINVPPFLTADCVTTPISLELDSTGPLVRDEDDPSLVTTTLRDANFSIPPAVVENDCVSIVRSEVDKALAGGGHSLELTMTGTVPEPDEVGEPTLTALEVAPAQVRAGQDVTLSSTVVPDPTGDGEGVPTGTVELRDGTTVIGTAELAAGVATFVTDDLPAGDHQLQARYLGDGDLFSSSKSAKVPYLVAAPPEVTIDMADTVLYGGRSRIADVVITNPSAEDFGGPVTNARVDLVLKRAATSSFFDANQVGFEWLDGDTWQPITLTFDSIARQATGTIGGNGNAGVPLAPGETRTIKLRVTMPSPVTTPPATACSVATAPCPGPWDLMAQLVEVDGGGVIVDALDDYVHRFTLIESVRRATTLTFLQGVPRPHTVRQGYSIEALVITGPAVGSVGPTGLAEVYIDGHRMPARIASDPYDKGYQDQWTVEASAMIPQVLLPADIGEGQHRMTVRYLGDALFAPAEVSTTFTVLPRAGFAFVCRAADITNKYEYGANVTFEADAPATAAAGSTVELDLGTVQYTLARPGQKNMWVSHNNNLTLTAGEGLLDGVSFALGEGGSGAATTVTRTGGSQISGPNPGDDSTVDQTIALGGATASVVVDGEPGDVVPVTLDEIKIDYHLSSPPLPIPHTCRPVGDAPVLDEVVIAGTTVTATPSPAREGTDVVEITAETFPADAAGNVSFSSSLDGSLGTEAVSGGVASIATDELSPGTHTITALFNASDPDVPDTIGTTTVVVTYSPRTDTEAFVVAARTDFLGSADGDDVAEDAGELDGGLSKVAYLRRLSRSDEYLARVVEELYQDTLGRPADDAGRTYWVGRLRAGWSVAKVTASFYGSGEYFARAGGGTVETWVDDLYGKLLGRSSDSSGRAYWVGETGRVGRGSVALRFFQTRESARARVIALYEHFLGRTPGAVEWGFWVPRVLAQGDLALAVELTNSGEYAGKAKVRFPLI